MKIYITDASSEGFFTAVFDAYRESDCLITSDENVQLALDSEVIRVERDGEKSLRVQNALDKYDRCAVSDVALVLRSRDGRKEQICLNYIRKLLTIKAPISKRMGLEEVMDFNDLAARICSEAHNMKGFLRFMESAQGIFYAPYSPDNDITELIMPHFAKRFSAERFVIHDVKRKLAGVYDGRSWALVYADEAEIQLSENQKAFEALWKKYYKAVNVKERPHEKQMRGYMPARYWKFMPEKYD